jgi:hypothetical protein
LITPPQTVSKPVNLSIKQRIARDSLGLSFLAVLLIFNAIALNGIAFRGFNQFDFGQFIDAGWRICHGQKPYTDFFLNIGPIHHYIMALFFGIFGFSKLAFFSNMAVISSTMMVLTYIAVRHRLPLILVLALTMLTGMGNFWSWPHPWYESTSHTWGMVAITALFLRLPFKSKKEAFWVAALCGSMAVLSLFTKQNSGGAYGVAFFATLMFSSQKRAAFLGYVSGCLLVTVFVFAFLIPSFKDFYRQTIVSSSTIFSKRIFNFVWLPTWFKHSYLFVAIFVAVTIGRIRRKQRSLFVLFLGIYFIGFFSTVTSSWLGPGHNPLMGIYLGIGFSLLSFWKPYVISLKRRVAFWLTVSLMLCILGIHYERAIKDYLTHYRIQHERYLTYNTDPLVYKLKAKPLEGWLLTQADGSQIDAIVDFVNSNIPKNESLLVMTNLQIIYPLTDRVGPRNMPITWHKDGYGPVLGDPFMITRKQLIENPPDWLLVSRKPNFQADDFSGLLKYLKLERFKDFYALVKSWGPYAILKRRYQIPSSPVPSS